MTARAHPLAISLLLPALLLAGCAASPELTPTSAPPPSAVATSPAPEPSTTSDADAGPPTCETIIPEATVEDYAELGWTSQAEPFRAGSIELDGGVYCRWGDHSIATDHLQIFGWAPVEADRADDAIAELIGSGWRREDEAEGVYVTESLDSAIAPVDGYGFTYLFGDGWVKFADTKQSLVLVEWPPR